MKEMEIPAVQPEKKKQKGFTLVELVAVIAVLGILAAVALPKFASIQGEARAAATQAARGSLSSAALMAHSKMLAANSMTVALDGRAMVGGTGNDWAAHYPVGDTAGWLAGLNEDPDPTGVSRAAPASADGWTYHGISDGGTAMFAGTTGAANALPGNGLYYWSPASAKMTNAVACYVSYTNASLGTDNSIIEPKITVLNTGCAASGM